MKATPGKRTRAERVRRSEGGYVLLALIVALMVIAILATAAVPNIKTQATRERELDAYAAGDAMAEGIARYYNRGRLGAQGLTLNLGAPPPYGFLQELKKLRDGVIVGEKTLRFVRPSAYLDPLTRQEWEPVRVGDPRVRKFFVLWAKATGRPIPPQYIPYMGSGLVRLHDDEDGDGVDDLPLTPSSGSGFPVPGSGGVFVPPGTDDEEGDDDEDEDDEEGDDEEGDETEDPGDEGARLLSSPDSPFVRVMFQEDGQDGSQDTTGDGAGSIPDTAGAAGQPVGRGSGTGGVKSPAGGNSFNNGQRIGPIIGVVSKDKGEAVKTRFGIKRHNEIVFIYMPPPPAVRPGQVQLVDKDGDGIDDRLQTATPGSGSKGP